PNFSFNSQKQKNKTTTGKNAPDGRIRGTRVLVLRGFFVFLFSAKNNKNSVKIVCTSKLRTAIKDAIMGYRQKIVMTSDY
ncbi:MAG: hypothetical protein FWF77_08205, partial [Defluviitaleaceae bacterium]|nr:hypothetical protein [Defluviitaleaceae bacterium]